MAKVPDNERVLEILRRTGQEISDDLAWVRHYLELADKCLSPGGKSPPEQAPEKISDTGSDQHTPEANATDVDDVEAAKAELNPPQARKQSA